ncbi:MAG: hypothetical protein HRU09_19875 [Oligoflexales bacterium]|nr:hypothetical protein [Oligoflexales bacterium]
MGRTFIWSYLMIRFQGGNKGRGHRPCVVGPSLSPLRSWSFVITPASWVPA